MFLELPELILPKQSPASFERCSEMTKRIRSMARQREILIEAPLTTGDSRHLSKKEWV
jgi:hypothetical protein